MNEFVAVRIGPRFIFVDLIPTLFLTVVPGALIAAGAPANAPSWDRLESSVHGLGWIGAALLALAVMTISIALHPLTYPMIQILEGHWEGLPGGRYAQERLSERYRVWRSGLRHILQQDPQDPRGGEALWIPDPLPAVLPTSLGNNLHAGEARAGRRYGLDTALGLRTIHPIMNATIRAEVADTRNQLDTAARMCVVALVSVPVTMVLLWPHETWLLVPFGCYLLAWASYRSAIAAARRFCLALSAAFDFHHLEIWDALSLPRPGGIKEEKYDLAPLLSRLLEGKSGLQPGEMARFRYISPEDSGARGNAPDPRRREPPAATEV